MIYRRIYQKESRQNPFHISIHHRQRMVEGDTLDRGRDIITDARQLLEVGRMICDLSGIFGHNDPGCAVEVPCPGIIPETLPRL